MRLSHDMSPEGAGLFESRGAISSSALGGLAVSLLGASALAAVPSALVATTTRAPRLASGPHVRRNKGARLPVLAFAAPLPAAACARRGRARGASNASSRRHPPCRGFGIAASSRGETASPPCQLQGMSWRQPGVQGLRLVRGALPEEVAHFQKGG